MSIGNEDNTVQAVKFSCKASQLTAELLLSVMKAAKQRTGAAIEKYRTTGKQSYKKLAEKGIALQKMDMSYDTVDLKSLKRLCREYRLDFALYQDAGANTYQLWYRQKDSAQLQAVLEKFVQRRLDDPGQQKESVKEKLNHIQPSAENVQQKSRELGERVKEISMVH